MAFLFYVASLAYMALYIAVPFAIIYIVCRAIKNRCDTNKAVDEIREELDEIEKELDLQNEITFSRGKIIRLSTESRE